MIIKPQFSLIILLFAFFFQCSSQPKKEVRETGVNNSVDRVTIQGFTQFPIYTGRNLLGYIPAEGNENTFDKKIWRGKVKSDKIQQSLTINYTKEDLKSLNASFLEIFSVEAGTESLQSVQLVLENPVQYTLEEISIEPEYKGNKELFGKSYIGSVLKVDKIKLEFTDNKGVSFHSEADLKVHNIKIGPRLKSSSAENAVFFAENAYVGYKLLSPPQNPESFIPEEDKRLKVVVIPFELDGTGEKEAKLRHALAEATAISLNRIPNVYVLDRNTYQKVLEEQELSKSENYDPKTAVKIGKLMTANTIFMGNFHKEGLKARISGKLINVETGALLPAGTFKHDTNLKGKTTPMIADEWENIVLKGMGVQTEKPRDELSVLGTNEGDAYDFYQRGRELFLKLDEDSLEDTIPLLKKALELDPEYSDAYALLAETYQRLYDFKVFGGDRISAEKMKIFGLEAAQRALELAPNSASAHRVNSFYYFYLEPDYEKSKFHALKAVEYDPKDAESAMRLFVVKVQENPALLSPENTDLVSAYNLNPNLISTNFYMGIAYKKKGSYEKALEYMKKIQEISPLSTSIYSEISNIYSAMGNWKEALAWIEKIDKLKPNNYQIQIYYANYYLQKNDHKKAMTYLEAAKSIQPRSTAPYEVIGKLSLMSGNLDEALSNFQKCTDLEPRKAVCHNLSARTYLRKKDISAAQLSLKKAIRLEPKNAALYETQSIAYEMAGNMEEVIQSYKKCIELQPGNINYRKHLAEAYVNTNSIDKAMEIYEALFKEFPEDASSYIEAGDILLLKKEYGKSRDYYLKALDLGDKGDQSSAYRGLGDIARKKKQYDDGIDLYTKAINTSNGNTNAKIGLAQCLSKKEKMAEVSAILYKLPEEDPGNAIVYSELARFQRYEGKTEESAKNFKKSCDMGNTEACDELEGKKKKKK